MRLMNRFRLYSITELSNLRYRNGIRTSTIKFQPIQKLKGKLVRLLGLWYFPLVTSIQRRHRGMEVLTSSPYSPHVSSKSGFVPSFFN